MIWNVMNIPLVNLVQQYKTIKNEIDAAISRVCRKTDFILGTEVEEFEKKFASYIGTRYCIGVASGTDAIKLMAMAAGIKRGDEVIIQDNTFIATALPFIELGAKPIFVDCDKTSGAIDVSHVNTAITKRTRAIIPVHLYGNPAPMDELMKLQKTVRGCTILEDAAQAHGSSVHGHMCGSIGQAAAFSFYPGKNLGAYGDGGAITTNNKNYADTIRIIRNIGQKGKYNHVRLGVNSRLDTIHAAILQVKLKHLNAWNNKRNKIARIYRKELANIGDIQLPPVPATGIVTNWHLFTIMTGKRDLLMKYLEKKDIHTGIHYPIPLHLTPALKFLGYTQGDFPVAEKRAGTILSLPLFAEMTDGDIEYIVTTIKKYYV